MFSSLVMYGPVSGGTDEIKLTRALGSCQWELEA